MPSPPHLTPAPARAAGGVSARPGGGVQSAWRLLALAVVVALVWLWQHDLFRAADWAVPQDYTGDAHEMLARIRAAAEGDTVPLTPQIIERLGAPWGASWNSYPASDKLLTLALGQLSRLIGLFEAANVALLAACVSAALAFYLAARRLHAQQEWALAGALLFAFSTSGLQRGLAHLPLLFTWTVPLGLLCCWHVARRVRVGWRTRDIFWALAAAVALGVGNPYNLFFWGQLMGWALLAQALGARHSANLFLGGVALAVAGVSFVLMHAELWLYAPRGTLPLLVRNYAGTEIYALKPVELLIPPAGHRWSWLAFWGERYARWSEWRGEGVSPYLGAVGAAGFLWLAAEAVVRLLRRRPPPGFALQAGWILMYGTVGGITNLLALYAGMHVFRATNRVSILLGAIALLFLARRLTTLAGGLHPVVRWSAAAVVAVFGLADQLPRRPNPEDREVRRRTVESDAAFGQALEQRLPQGSKVFQLPIQGFPEVQPPHRLRDYELFRPYLHTTSLRFTYGAAKHRSRSKWQRELEGVPVHELIGRLESHGFAAVHINRRAFEDGGAALIAGFEEAGYADRIDGRLGEQVAFPLRPASEPLLPLARSVTFGRGWYPRAVVEDGESVRWAHGRAVLVYFNPSSGPLEVSLGLVARAVTERRLQAILNGDTVVIDTPIGPNPKALGPIAMTLTPGVNRIVVRTDRPPVGGGGGGARLRDVGFSQITMAAPPVPVGRD